MPILQLLPQPLMECQRTRLRTAIVHDLPERHETSLTSHRHDMAMVSLDHGREELLHGEKVRNRIHFECLSDLGLRFVEDRRVVGDTCVVNKDCWMAVLAPDLLCHGVQCGRGGDVCFVEVDVGCCFILVAESLCCRKGGVRSLKVGSLMSRMITFAPCEDNSVMTCLPIPLHPPVRRTSSRALSHFRVLILLRDSELRTRLVWRRAVKAKIAARALGTNGCSNACCAGGGRLASAV